MKQPFKLTKTNILYALITTVIVIFFNILLVGYDANTYRMSIGAAIVIFLIPTLLALFFWFILGKREKVGAKTFNIVLTFLFLGLVSEYGYIAKNQQKPLFVLQNAFSEYKESMIANPDSTDLYYTSFSVNVKKSIDDLIKRSVGDERKVWLALKDLFNKSESTKLEWDKAYDSFSEPRILDYHRLNNKEEFEFQKQVVHEYINQSENYKSFVDTRIDNLKEQTKRIDKNNKVYRGFIKGLTEKDSLQKPFFLSYINAHIEYGQGIKKIIELLENEQGKWSYDSDTETLIFEDSDVQSTFENILSEVISNEEIINELYDKLVEIM